MFCLLIPLAVSIYYISFIFFSPLFLIRLFLLFNLMDSTIGWGKVFCEKSGSPIQRFCPHIYIRVACYEEINKECVLLFQNFRKEFFIVGNFHYPGARNDLFFENHNFLKETIVVGFCNNSNKNVYWGNFRRKL